MSTEVPASGLRRAAPLAGAALLLLLVHRALLGPGVPAGRDLLFHFYPAKAALAEAVRAGEVPWVDRYRWGGMPLLAAPAVAAFDPGNVLFLLLPLAAAAKGWMLLRLLTALWGFAVFSRQWGVSRGAAATAGLAYALSGVTTSVLPFLPTSSAHAVLPWLAAALVSARRRPGRRTVAAAAAAAGLIVVAAIPEYVHYGLFVGMALAPGAIGGETGAEGGETAVRRWLPAWIAAAALAAALSAPTVVSYASAGVESVRGPGGGFGERVAEIGSLAPVRLKELLADGLVADWSRVATAPGVDEYPYFPTITPGRVALLLALAGLFSRGGARFRAVGLTTLGVLLALGPATPVWGAVCRVVPFLSSVRYPEKHLALATFGACWLAALGLGAVERRLAAGRRGWALAALAIAVAADREAPARELLWIAPSSIVDAPPPVLAPLVSAPREGVAPRVVNLASYLPHLFVAGTRDPMSQEGADARFAIPQYPTLFGVGSLFAPDYDLSLPVQLFEWSRLYREAAPSGSPSLARIARAAGASAMVGVRARPGLSEPVLERLDPPVGPFRFVTRVVRDADGRRLFGAMLREGPDLDTAYLLDPAASRPSEEHRPRGSLVAVRDAADGLTLEVEAPPGGGTLLVCRPRQATAEARMDGRPAAVLDASLGFAALDVPEGRHRVTLRPERRAMLGAFIVGGMALALLAWLALSPKKPSRPADSGPDRP